MSEQNLLLRCRQTIQILNQTILTHKKDIQRFQIRNRSLSSQLQMNQALRNKLTDEISSIKRQSIQQKAQRMIQLHKIQNLLSEANREIDSKRIANTSLQRRLLQSQKQSEQLRNKIRRNQQLFQSQQKQLNRRITNLQKNNGTIFQQRDNLLQTSNIYKQQLQSLKLQCQSLNSQLQHSRAINIKTSNDVQREITGYQIKHGEYSHVIGVLEGEKMELLGVIEKQRVTIEEYKGMVDRVQYWNRSLKEEVEERSREGSMLGRRELEVGAKKKGKMFERLVEIELGVRKMMQEIEYQR